MNKDFEKRIAPAISEPETALESPLEAIQQMAEQRAEEMQVTIEPIGDAWMNGSQYVIKAYGGFQTCLETLIICPMSLLETYRVTAWLRMFIDPDGLFKNQPNTRRFATSVRGMILAAADPITHALVRHVMECVNHYSEYILDNDPDREKFQAEFLVQLEQLQAALAGQLNAEMDQVLSPDHDPHLEINQDACEVLTSIILWLIDTDEYFKSRIQL